MTSSDRLKSVVFEKRKVEKWAEKELKKGKKMFNAMKTNREKGYKFCAKCGDMLDGANYIRGHTPMCISCRADFIQQIREAKGE